MAAEGVSEDGRTARRDRNKEAVLDAVISLFAEDLLYPGPEQVAARSGVSRRSVQRYFDDMDALARAAMARHLDRARPLFEVDGLGEGPVERRVDRLVASRVRGFGAVAPVMRAALHRAPGNALIAEQLAEARRGLLLQVAVIFAPEVEPRPILEQREVVSGVDLLLGFESIDRLRQGRRLPVAAVRRTLVRAVRAQL